MANDMPTIGSDEWFYWLLDQLNGRGAGTILDDAKINAVVSNTDSHTRATIVALFTSADAETLTLAKAYADAAALAAQNAAKSYADSKDATTLTGAKVYTDASVSGILNTAKAYSDSKDVSVRADAYAHTDSVVGNVLTGANQYTDGQVSTERTARVNGDAATLAEAKRYADSIGGSGGSFDVFKQYADQGDNTVEYNAKLYTDAQRDAAVQAAAADATSKDASTLTAAKAYADSKGGISQAQMDAADAATLTTAKAYSDGMRTAAVQDALTASNSGDQDTLAAAKSYTDDSAETLATNLSSTMDQKVQAGTDAATGYADGLNTTTRGLLQDGDTASVTTSKAYTDTRETAVRSAYATADATTLASAKAYADAKDAGWTDLSSAVGSVFTGTGVAARKVGSRVTLYGQIARTSGANIGTETGLITLPAGLRPIKGWASLIAGAGSVFSKASVQTTGSVDCSAPSAATTYVRLDGISFYID